MVELPVFACLEWYHHLDVKPIDASTGSAYSNTDPAGTPEALVADFVSSATMGCPATAPPPPPPALCQPPTSPATQYTGGYGPSANAYFQAYLLTE